MTQNSYSTKDPESLSHLQMIQGIINRMASNSVLCKNLCISISGMMSTVAIAIKNYNILLISIIPILFFYCLDARYLQLEREYRDKFNEHSSLMKIKKFDDNLLFNLNTLQSGEKGFYEALISFATFPLYTLLLSIIFIIYFTIIIG